MTQETNRTTPQTGSEESEAREPQAAAGLNESEVDAGLEKSEPSEPDAQVDSTEPEAKGSKRRAAGLLVFSVVFLLLCAFPFAGLLFAPSQMTSDTDTLSEAPALFAEDGAFRLSYLSDAGDYFEDHFAYRNQIIDLNARIKVGLFATSPTDQVVVGEDGWLFYGGTLSDYLGTDPLSERELVNIVHNLEIIQGYTEAQGARFVLAIAPNKNTLYPEHMPYYLAEGDDDSTQRLLEACDAKNIDVLDLFTLFEEQPETLYYKTDTHWNEQGALLVSNELLESVDKDELAMSDETTASLLGDIELMLYPVTAEEEQAVSLESRGWHYLGEADSVEDDAIDTEGEGEGVLLMYRDSFANNLIPLLAPSFEQAHFTKLVPYNLSQINSMQADVVVIERAERHIDLLGEEAPFILAPTVTLDGEVRKEASPAEGALSWHEDGDFRAVEGWVDASVMSNEAQIFIEVEGPSGNQSVLVPFYVSTAKTNGNEVAQAEDTPYGFKLYLDEHTLEKGDYTFKVLVSSETEGTTQAVFTQTLQHE